MKGLLLVTSPFPFVSQDSILDFVISASLTAPQSIPGYNLGSYISFSGKLAKRLQVN